MKTDINIILPRLGKYLDRTPLDIDESLYCEGSFSFEWSKSKPIIQRKKGKYENLIYEFLIHEIGEKESNNNLLIIIGDVGSGKSTAITKIIKKVQDTPRRCPFSKKANNLCEEHPIIIKFNFNYIESKISEKEEVLINEFWNSLLADLKRITNDIIDSIENLSKYWLWLLSNHRFIRLAPNINRILSGNIQYIKSFSQNKSLGGWSNEQIKKMILSLEPKIYYETSYEELTWYNIFMFIYQKKLEKKRCLCELVFVDNIDHLAPKI